MADTNTVDISHERPALDMEDFKPPMSEFEQHKVARGFAPPPAVPVQERPAPEPVAEPVAAAPEPADLVVDEPALDPQLDPKHRFSDPDTNETLDLRRRPAKRIKALLSERAQLRAQIDDLSRRISQPVAEPATPTQPVVATVDPADPEPTIEQFQNDPDPYLALVRATAKWEARQTNRQLESQRQARDQQTQATQHAETLDRQWNEKLPAVKEKYPDFDSAYASFWGAIPKEPRGTHLAQLVMTSPVGHDLAYFLGQHPDELAALYTVGSLDAHFRALGKLEARVEASVASPTAPKPITHAQTSPVTPVNSAGPAVNRSAEAIAKAGDLQAWRQSRGMPAYTGR